jgi:hypothetical protein
MGNRTVINNLLYFLSFATELGVHTGAAVFVLDLLAHDFSLQLYTQYPNIFCMAFSAR